jgi:hypothetical protein
MAKMLANNQMAAIIGGGGINGVQSMAASALAAAAQAKQPYQA